MNVKVQFRRTDIPMGGMIG